MQIRNCRQEDIQKVRHFVSLCKPLGVHTGYTYWMLFNYFHESCFLMEENGQLIGYVSGMQSNTFEDVFFLWQIGVAEECRGRGYSYLLLEKAVEAAKKLGCKTMQFSVETASKTGLKAFSGFATKNNLKMSAIGEINYPHSVRETMEQDTLYEITI